MKCFKLLVPVLLAFSAGAASAQNYPNKPVKVVVPYAPGGLPDTMARLLTQKMADSLGQQFIIENRGGAGGISGTAEVARAPADGYTLLVADVAQIAINPHLFAKLPYKPLEQLVGISLIGYSPLYLVAHPSVPVKDMKELIAFAKANPGKLSYGSSGTGSLHHLATEAIKSGLSLDLLHVPYKGTGQSVPALLGGQVQLLYSALPSIEGYLKGGQVKMLASSGPKRAASTPDVPSVAEFVPGYDFVAEISLYAPAGTPPAVVKQLAGEVSKAVKQQDLAQRFKQLGIDPVGGTPEQLASMNRASYQKYEKVVKLSGAKID